MNDQQQKKKLTLRETRNSHLIRLNDLWAATREVGYEVSPSTIAKAERGIPISRVKAIALIRAFNHLTQQEYTREDFPDLKIIEEGEENRNDDGTDQVA